MCTCFFQGCWGKGLLAEMKRLDVDTIHAREHDCKASLALLVLLRRAGGRSTGSHCNKEHALRREADGDTFQHKAMSWSSVADTWSPISEETGLKTTTFAADQH